MKKTIYITLFTILGILLSTIVHGLIEVPVIYILVSDFEKYSLGLSWSDWRLVHHIMTVILFMGGVWFGLYFGFKFWKLLYEGDNPLYKVPFWKRGAVLRKRKSPG